MTLEFHDNEARSIVAKKRGLDLDYQAEKWVRDTIDLPKVIKWILFDDIGVRCVWERKVGDPGMPDITQRSTRFTGEWQKGPAEAIVP